MKNNVNIEAAIPDELGLHRLSRLAPRPRCPEDTGLSRELLTDLTAKHLLDRGAMTLGGLAVAIGSASNLDGFLLQDFTVDANGDVFEGPGLA